MALIYCTRLCTFSSFFSTRLLYFFAHANCHLLVNSCKLAQVFLNVLSHFIFLIHNHSTVTSFVWSKEMKLKCVDKESEDDIAMLALSAFFVVVWVASS